MGLRSKVYVVKFGSIYSSFENTDASLYPQYIKRIRLLFLNLKRFSSSSLLWPAGGAAIAAQWRAGVVLGDDSPRGVPDRPQKWSTQTLPSAGLEQRSLPQENDGMTTTRTRARVNAHGHTHRLIGPLAPAGSPAQGLRHQASLLQGGVQ